MRAITDLPPRAAIARFQAEFGQRFLVTVDASEEADRNLQFDNRSQRADHLARIAQFQRFCEEERIVPLYLFDWPIAMAGETADLLRDIVAKGAAEIGLQLHPYTRHPFEDGADDRTDRPGTVAHAAPSLATRNFSELEGARFQRLRDAIEREFGTTLLACRTGPQGFGQETARFLVREGIAIDSSVRPAFDFSPGGGPNYRKHPPAPYWLDGQQTLLELPLSTVYWGLLRRQGDLFYPRSRGMRDLLARCGLLERITLSPEASDVEQAIRGIDIALDDGLPLLVFSFHSMTLPPSTDDAAAMSLHPFYDWWQRVLAYLDLRSVGNASIAEIMQAVER